MMNYRFVVKSWEKLARPIQVKKVGHTVLFTNLFLLQHSSEYPELLLRSEEKYRLFTELSRRMNGIQINKGKDSGFTYQNKIIILENDKINACRNHKIRCWYYLQDFRKNPNAVFRKIMKEIAP